MILCLNALSARAEEQQEWHACSGNGWEISGAESEDRELICEGVAKASDFLASCGVEGATAPRIRVTDMLPRHCGVAAWGVYDSVRNEIELGNPAICATEAQQTGLFGHMAPSLAYLSIVAHEATHAILFSRGLGADRYLEHEYIASVVSMQILPEAAREAYLAPMPLASQVALWELTPFLHLMNPELFTGRAWRHFDAQPENCLFLRALSDGLLRLPDFSAF